MVVSSSFLCVCVFKTEQDQEAEENSMIYADLKAARETIEELKQEKGFLYVRISSRDIFADVVFM